MDDSWRELEQQGVTVTVGKDADRAYHETRTRDGWKWRHYENGLQRGSHPVYFPGVKRPHPPTVLERLGWPWWKRLWWEW